MSAVFKKYLKYIKTAFEKMFSIYKNLAWTDSSENNPRTYLHFIKFKDIMRTNGQSKKNYLNSVNYISYTHIL